MTGTRSKVDDASLSDLASALASLRDAPEVDKYLALCESTDVASAPPQMASLFVRFREDSPDIEAFAEFLWQQAINYAIPLRKRRQALKRASASATSGDLALITRLVAETKRAFIEFNAAHPGRASEVGEVLAYCLALHYLQAAQIASKMALKTSSNMPVHGLDGIHARFENGVMTLYFLESKLRSSAAQGVDDYAKSVADFATNRKQYLLEYTIIQDMGNLEALRGADRELALEYLDVYGSKKSQRLERSIGVVCYSETKHSKTRLPKSDSTSPQDHEEHYKSLLKAEFSNYRKASQEALNESQVPPDICKLFLVAVPSIAELRQAFYDKLNG